MKFVQDPLGVVGVPSLPARERGLKCQGCDIRHIAPVAPREGAWIEICQVYVNSRLDIVAPREGAWIEIRSGLKRLSVDPSLPARERGLKCGGSARSVFNGESLPARERGLKCFCLWR